VVCPMCETPGYMAQTDAGKDVHCCNPSCMVPVFKTKKPQVEEAPKVEQQGNRTLIYGGAAVLLIGAAVGGAYVLLSPKQEVKENAVIEIPVETRSIESLITENTRENEANKALATLPEIMKASLAAFPDKIRIRDKNRHQEYGVQLAAESYADAGDLTKAREQIARLQRAGAGVAYLQIEPLVQVGWHQLNSGKQAEAVETAKEALTRTKGIPRTVRRTQDAVISLAALLVQTGLLDEAKALIDQEQDVGPRGNLSAYWRCAVTSHTFNVDDESRFSWHLNIPEPMRMGVVETLVSRNQADTALKFTETGRDVASRAACRAAWAGRLTLTTPENIEERIAAAIDAGKFDLPTQIQIWAAVSDAAHYRKQGTVAQSALGKGVALLETLPAPAVPKFPSMKAVYEGHGRQHGGLPDPAPAKSAALAASGIALAQLQQGKTADALKTLEQALDHYRAMTPSPTVTKARYEDCQKRETSVRSALGQAINQPSEDRLRIAFNNYRQQCDRLNQIARGRLDLQVAILRRFAVEGHAAAVWTLAEVRNSAGNEDLREPYRETSLAGFVMAIALAKGDRTLADSIKGLFQEKPLVPEPIDEVEAVVTVRLATGKIADAKTILGRAYRSNLAQKASFQLDLIAMQAAGRVQKTSSLTDTIDFIQGLDDLLVQEDLFLLLAGDAVNRGTAPQLWNMTKGARDIDVLEFLSLYRGFVKAIAVPRQAE